MIATKTTIALRQCDGDVSGVVVVTKPTYPPLMHGEHHHPVVLIPAARSSRRTFVVALHDDTIPGGGELQPGKRLRDNVLSEHLEPVRHSRSSYSTSCPGHYRGSADRSLPVD